MQKLAAPSSRALEKRTLEMSARSVVSQYLAFRTADYGVIQKIALYFDVLVV